MEGQTQINQVTENEANESIKQAQSLTMINKVQHKNPGQKLDEQKQQVNEKHQNKNKKINKKKKKEQQIVYKNLNAFKEQQKHFKLYQDRQTDFSQIYDIQSAKKLQIEGYTVYNLATPEEGAYIIKGFNSAQIVNLIGYLGLNEFWKRPYRTNLNSRNQLYDGKQEHKKEEENKQQIQEQIKGQSKVKSIDFQSKVQSIDFQQTYQQFAKQVTQKGYSFNDKIRWANVGHQYDWTLRKYPQYHTPMHPAIKQLTDRANIIYNKIQQIQRQYYPESGIVNYYGVKDYMTGHLDDAEYDQVSPIYSFSFGISCVFLMGGMNKDVKPLAIRLDSGDLMIMAKNSRKCYHGVPRIISGTYKPNEPKFDPQDIPKNYNSPKQVEKYFSNHRININIRQVFPQHN